MKSQPTPSLPPWKQTHVSFLHPDSCWQEPVFVKHATLCTDKGLRFSQHSLVSGRCQLWQEDQGLKVRGLLSGELALEPRWQRDASRSVSMCSSYESWSWLIARASHSTCHLEQRHSRAVRREEGLARWLHSWCPVSNFRTHVVAGENQFPQVVLWSPYSHHEKMHTYPPTYPNNKYF